MPEQSPSRRTQNSRSCRASPAPGTRRTTSNLLIPYLTPPAYTANTALAHLAERGLTVALDGNDGDGVPDTGDASGASCS